MVEQTVKLGGRVYQHEQTVDLWFASSYVPTWSLERAVAESVQNAYDEAFRRGAQARVSMDGGRLIIRDNGQGVSWRKLLRIGDTDKRGVPGMVGQHGEGDVVGSLVITRKGYVKWASSQDWAMTIEFGPEGEVLAHVYRSVSGSTRRGTRIEIHVPDGQRYGAMVWDLEEAMRGAKERFRNHAYKIRQRPWSVRKGEGRLYTRGAYVQTTDRTVLDYNLDLTPGRDRASFDLGAEDIKDALGQAWDKASWKEVAVVLRVGWSAGPTTLEYGLDGHGISTNAIKRAARSLGGLYWANSWQRAKITDAGEMGERVIVFYSDPPEWVERGVQNVRYLHEKKGPKGRENRKIARDLQETIEHLMELLVGRPDAYGVELYTELGGAEAMSGNPISLAYEYVRSYSAADLLHTLAHEIAHNRTGAEDCTREHTNAMGKLLAGVAERVVLEHDALRLYKRAHVRMERWTASKAK